MRQQPIFKKNLDKQIKAKELGNAFFYSIFDKLHMSTFINCISYGAPRALPPKSSSSYTLGRTISTTLYEPSQFEPNAPTPGF